MKNYKIWLTPPVLFPIMLIAAILVYLCLRTAV
jgi:hypothetical protein